MWSVKHPDFTMRIIFWNQFRRCNFLWHERFCNSIDVQNVAMTQRAPGMSAKFSQTESGFAAKKIRHVKSTPDCEITAAARAFDSAQSQNASGANVNALPK